MSETCGYKEVQHTADWELKVWAQNLPDLIKQAALGMYALQETKLYPLPRVMREIELDASDNEEILVKFLNELLYQNEQYGLGFDTFNINIKNGHLKAKLNGASLAHQAQEIKAVTYHNLKILQTERGLETRIVFDV